MYFNIYMFRLFIIISMIHYLWTIIERRLIFNAAYLKFVRMLTLSGRNLLLDLVHIHRYVVWYLTTPPATGRDVQHILTIGLQ